MAITRRAFLQFMGCLVGGWTMAVPRPPAIGSMARFLAGWGDLSSPAPGEQRSPALEGNPVQGGPGIISAQEGRRLLAELGRYVESRPETFMFDESKYSPLKREIERSDWNATNRHLPIKLDPQVVNRPGERSPEALKEAVAYTGFYNPRYVALPGERASMCNIAAWDWSRALRVHLPHWIGETEMSANMLFRWISHSRAGGVHGEGWQPVSPTAAQLLANQGIPVFALVENPTPGRHGHVALVYPKTPVVRMSDGEVEPNFASVRNGRGRGGNGVMDLRATFRWLQPSYFVHQADFLVHLV